MRESSPLRKMEEYVSRKQTACSLVRPPGDGRNLKSDRSPPALLGDQLATEPDSGSGIYLRQSHQKVKIRLGNLIHSAEVSSTILPEREK